MLAQVVAIEDKAADPAGLRRTAVPRVGLSRLCERPAVHTESALALLWQRAHTLSDGLVTEDGRRFRVVYPGRPNKRAGPDFRDSVISTDEGRLLAGDVELHLEARDCASHGHESDPNYNGVILHVVPRAKGRVSSSKQSRIGVPVASLGPVVGRLDRPEKLPILRYLPGPVSPGARWTTCWTWRGTDVS